jgi:hypothetical protein
VRSITTLEIAISTRERMAGVSEKVVTHLASMNADSILTRSAQVEKIDSVARRTFGLDNTAIGNGALNLNVLCGGRAVVQIAPTPAE